MIPAAELIQRKRDGAELSAEEIVELVLAYTRDEVPDYQMAAFCMAVYFQGLTPGETHALTDAMVRSGETVDLSPLVRCFKFYGKLRKDQSLFETVHLIEDGEAIAWGDDDEHRHGRDGTVSAPPAYVSTRHPGSRAPALRPGRGYPGPAARAAPRRRSRLTARAHSARCAWPG